MSPSACYPDRAKTVNSILRTLADDHRRELIYYFERVHESDVAEVSELVVRLDAEIPGCDPERLHVRLIHSHLPKLDDHGWIDFDPRTETVRYHGHDRAHRDLSELCAVFE